MKSFELKIEQILTTTSVASKNDTSPTIGQKWLQNNQIAFFI